MALEWLDEIERRANAATPVPWTGFDYDAAARNYRIRVHTGPTGDLWREATMEDFEFIFRAPTDVPRLCRAVRELYAALDSALSILSAVDVSSDIWQEEAETLERWRRGGS